MVLLNKTSENYSLSSLRILVTNDDGIHAPGLKILTKIARTISNDVWTVAPEQEQSGAGHSLTLSKPLRIRKLANRRYSVDGTPTDCVLLGVKKILPRKKPTLILSGVNFGGNIGEDATYSGTVAAAMEGILLNIPAIALSQVVTRTKTPKWSTALHFAPPIIKKLLETGWPQHILININFPDLITSSVKGVRVVSQGFRPAGVDQISENLDPRERVYYWIGPQADLTEFPSNTDLEAISQGYVSITPMDVNFTHKKTLPILRTAFEEFKL